MLNTIWHTTKATLVFLVLLTAPLAADEAATTAFLPKDAIDGKAVIGPPPAADSAEHRTQMAIVLWLQKTRTPEQVVFVETPLNLQRFAPLLSGSLMDVNGIELSSTFEAVIDQVRVDYDALKAFYDEPRPFQVNDAVKPVGQPRPVGSYPSGHAIRSVVYGRLLSELFPEHEQALMELARQIGYGRAIAGVHYPYDVEAGQKLGEAYAAFIVQQPAFIQAVARIQGKPVK